MPITRRALLISNPGETGDEHYCKGVYVDIKNYQRLLTSPVGGAWDTAEIRHLDRPSAKEVNDWVSSVAVHDYVLVMFTGHGWYSSTDRDRILELREGERIASLDLIKGAKRRTVILDCCQKVHPETLMEKTERLIAFSNASRGRTPNAAACRQLFFENIQSAPLAIVKMTSCSIGEVSTDDDTSGGRYNGSLIECVDDWTAAQAAKPYYASTDSFSVVAAHESAAAKTRTLSAGQQNPVIEKPRTAPYFPIAVFA